MGSRSWVAFLPTSSERVALWAPQPNPRSPTFLQQLIAFFLEPALAFIAEDVKAGQTADQAFATFRANLQRTLGDVESGVTDLGRDLERDAAALGSDLSSVGQQLFGFL